MLGFGKMTQQGTGTVVSCQISRGGFTSKDSHGARTDRFDVILDVTPDSGESPFRAETHQRFDTYRFPSEGDTLKVRCDPKKKGVEIDLSEDERFNPTIFRRADEEERKRVHDETLSAEPDTPPTWAEEDDPDLAELARLEEKEGGSGER